MTAEENPIARNAVHAITLAPILLIPQSHGAQAGIAKWIFFGFRFTTGVLVVAFGLFKSKRLAADRGQIGALIKAGADMAKKDQ